MKLIESYKLFLEKELKKGKWGFPDVDDRADELIDLVQTAYRRTPEGSFVNSKGDLLPSEWLSIDFNQNPKLDATIFYREPRKNETWIGKKIQGLGHDDSKEAKTISLNKLIDVLGQDGVWVEASDALEHVLYKKGVPYIEDEDFLQSLFPNSGLKMTGDRGKYTRSVSGKKIKETVFGKPRLK